MNKLCLIFVLSLCFTGKAPCQDTARANVHILFIDTIDNGDTTFFSQLPAVTIIPQKTFATKREQRKYDKLVSRVKKVYPLAKTAGMLLQQYAPILDTLQTKRERDKYFDVIEDELWAKYGDNLKNLTMSQGAILLKLVDRECQQSSYFVIKDFRGFFSAFFYQTMARLWGYNLKVKYDPQGEDKDIEEIVLLIESGMI